MASKVNRKCIICGKEYSYCPNCGPDKKKPTWYAIFDGENCNSIYEICTNYRDGIIDKETAKVKLLELDLSKIDNEGFNESSRKQIKEIIGEVDKPIEQVEIIDKQDEVEETPIVITDPIVPVTVIDPQIETVDDNKDNKEDAVDKIDTAANTKKVSNYNQSHGKNNNKHFHK